MHLFYGVLAYVMAGFNLVRFAGGQGTKNLVLGLVWLALGIVYTVRHIRALRAARRKKERREENG